MTELGKAVTHATRWAVGRLGDVCTGRKRAKAKEKRL